MTKIVDFYVLENHPLASRVQFACRIAAKAYQEKLNVFLQIADVQLLSQCNELLWTFNDIAFLPHQIDTASELLQAPIILGHALSKKTAHFDALILLSDSETISCLEAFTGHRIIEIIPEDERVKDLARKRYALYRQAEYSVKTHKISR